MKKIILSMARSGSSSLATSFDCFSVETVSQETVNGETIPFNGLEEIDSSMFKMMTHDYNYDELCYLVENNKVALLYRKDRFERALSMCIGNITQIWQKPHLEKIGNEDYYNNKIFVDKDSFLYRLKFQDEQEEKIFRLSTSYNLPVFSYESLYYVDTRYELESLNSYFGSDLDIDSALDFLVPANGKLNDYSNVGNFEDILRWYSE